LVLEHGASNSNDALGAASPYLRMFGLVVGGWVMARQAIAARRLGLDDPYHEAKLVTARFYVEELLPQVHGLTAAVESSSDVLLALTPDQLRSTAS
jgi:hypothetical protein